MAAEPPSPVTVESDFVVILAALLCALICVVGLIAVARCAWLRQNARRERWRAAVGEQGLKKVLQSLPKFTYDPKQLRRMVLSTAECAICLAEYAVGVRIRVLPPVWP
ncbi:hypothetical protein HAX54_045625 [Datura stramonium]|uniref:Uncharacterized protein n=1 Tax=Datura stramonium TaxID=4076 RepID=A0ABS8RPG2_DATST|nr:hypothetical protein [Datura stramonium]